MAIPGAVPASMGRRLLAFVIDAVAALLVGGAFVAASLLPLLGSGGEPDALDRAVAALTGPFALLGYGLLVLLGLVQWWALGRRGWTIGKRLVQLRAVSPRTGRPVGMGRALLRFLVPAAGTLVLGVGQLVVYLSPFWDSGGRRQGWHDKAAGTMVLDVAIGPDPTLMAPPGGEVSRRLDGLMRTEPAVEGRRLELEQPNPALPPVPGADAPVTGSTPLSAGAPVPAAGRVLGDVPADREAAPGDAPVDREAAPGDAPVDSRPASDSPPASADAQAGPDPAPGSPAVPAAPSRDASGAGTPGPDVGGLPAVPPPSDPRAPRPVFPSTIRKTSADDGPSGTRRTPAPRPVFPSMRRTDPADENRVDAVPAEPAGAPESTATDAPESSGQGSAEPVPAERPGPGVPWRVATPETATPGDVPEPVPPPMDAGPDSPPGMISMVPWLHPSEPEGSDTAPTGEQKTPAGEQRTPADPTSSSPSPSSSSSPSPSPSSPSPSSSSPPGSDLPSPNLEEPAAADHGSPAATSSGRVTPDERPAAPVSTGQEPSSRQDPPPLPDLPDEVEQTRLRPARGRVPEMPGPVPPSATLHMSDGRRVEFRGIALVGRDPTPRPGEDPDLLVRVADPGRSVSKTHLAVGTDRAGIWVADRDSTNGTVVTLGDGQQILCGADQVVRLPEHASVSFGDYGFTVTLLEEL